MELLLLILVVLIIAAGLVVAFKRKQSREDGWPFYARKVMTAPEQVLFHRLTKALPEHIVLAQVQASRVLGVKQGANFGAWHNRVNRLSLDYVVCRKDSAVVAAIELDDDSHSKASRQYADFRKDKALQAAGIPLVRWRVTALPDSEAIKEAFTNIGHTIIPDRSDKPFRN
jgi:hypothetical protein